ncbi:MAG: SDR family oxidoreductase [Spirochaetales bacterium]|nr:SDR family oxidoreductase [Spirochaetales bacterium]
MKELAIITGASSGIGLDIARSLGKRQFDLIVAARREDRLLRLKQELESAHKIQVHVLPCDLSLPQAAQELYRKASTLGRVTALVNNAGFGIKGPFVNHEPSQLRNMLAVNVTSLTDLTRLFLPDMVANKHGYIMQIASIGAFQPSPEYAVYSATKSYVLSFSYALNRELSGSGVSVTTICPGITETEFHTVARHQKSAFLNLMNMKSDAVAEASVRAMLSRKAILIPGFLNRVNSLLMESMPRWLSTAIAGAAVR